MWSLVDANPFGFGLAPRLPRAGRPRSFGYKEGAHSRVSRILSGGGQFLRETAISLKLPRQPARRSGCDYYPEIQSRTGRPSPVLSCTMRGLLCPIRYRPGGGLLPHLFQPYL